MEEARLEVDSAERACRNARRTQQSAMLAGPGGLPQSSSPSCCWLSRINAESRKREQENPEIPPVTFEIAAESIEVVVP